MSQHQKLIDLARLVRYWSLTSTTEAGSGHPSSSLSAADLMVGLMFGGGFRYDLKKPHHSNNDRLIFSKGHASPLFYALYAAAGAIKERELHTLRDFNSRLEGHPTSAFPYTEAATGSLGQGLSIGLGIALNAKYIDKLPYRTYVLLGDSEMAEGSVWEALQLAAHYKLDNLVGIIDVNRLGQRGQTMAGHNTTDYKKKVESFGWKAIVIDGHDISAIVKAYQQALKVNAKPVMIIAKTLKGKGVSLMENKNNWHGKALSKKELVQALVGLGPVDTRLRGVIKKPANRTPAKPLLKRPQVVHENYDAAVSTRKAYGHALVKLFPKHPNMVVLDAEVSNSTYAETFKKAYPDRFFEMFIAEQNMVGVAAGLAACDKVPFVSTFSAFLTRAFDQIRMTQYAGKSSRINFVGSHAGVSIGADGSSQMGLEDIAMFRTLLNSAVLYPSDHVSQEKLVDVAIKHQGPTYIRTTRMDTAPLYKASEKFILGGSKVLRRHQRDVITVVAAGVTLYEALKAYEILKKDSIYIRVIDLYSIKPIDRATLHRAAKKTKAIITVEDHFEAGGIGEAVRSALEPLPMPVHSLAVRKMTKSGKPEELLRYENIDSAAIVKKVRQVLG